MDGWMDGWRVRHIHMRLPGSYDELVAVGVQGQLGEVLDVPVGEVAQPGSEFCGREKKKKNAIISDSGRYDTIIGT